MPCKRVFEVGNLPWPIPKGKAVDTSHDPLYILPLSSVILHNRLLNFIIKLHRVTYYCFRNPPMASFPSSSLTIFVLFLIIGSTSAQLSINFYYHSCPDLFTTIKSAVHSAISKEARMGASLLRLFFHDCFVNVIHLNIFASSLTIYLCTMTNF